MKYMRVLDILPIVVTLISFNTSMNATQDNDNARSLAQLEQKWIALFQRPDSAMLENLLADDFIYTSDATTLSKREFIAQAEKTDFSKKRIELADSKVRVYGTAAISTGSAALRPRADDQIKGDSKVASGASIINLGELSHQKKPPPSAEPRAVPAPMPVPQGRTVPVADAQYRYTAMYVKLRGGWQMVALNLSRATRE